MNQQEQIDYLKRTVTSQEVAIKHIQNALEVFLNVLAVPPNRPICNQCGMVLYDNASCGQKANVCPFGISHYGVKD